MTRATRLAVGVVCVVLLVSGCSDDSKPKSSSSSSSSAPPASSSAKPSAVIQAPDAPRTSGFVGARADVTGLTCEKSGNGWKVGGTVTNPTAAPVDYRIFTSFLDTTNDTAGLLQTDVKAVGPAAAQPWSGQLAVPGSDLHCVLRVERTDAGAK